MKTISFVLLFISIVFSSCKKECLYSCDPIIEQWAINNYNKLRKIDRKGLLNLKNYHYRRAAYRILSTQDKQNIWKDKLHELQKLNWSKPEWNHILQIYSLILTDTKESILNIKEIENNDSLLIQLYRWKEYAKEHFKWTKKQIYAICYTPDKVLNKEGDLYYNIEASTESLSRTEYGNECSCSQVSSYCDIMDHEDPDYTTCKTPNNGSCNIVDGCGLFWQFKCDGMCLGLWV